MGHPGCHRVPPTSPGGALSGTGAACSCPRVSSRACTRVRPRAPAAHVGVLRSAAPQRARGREGAHGHAHVHGAGVPPPRGARGRRAGLVLFGRVSRRLPSCKLVVGLGLVWVWNGVSVRARLGVQTAVHVGECVQTATRCCVCANGCAHVGAYVQTAVLTAVCANGHANVGECVQMAVHTAVCVQTAMHTVVHACKQSCTQLCVCKHRACCCARANSRAHVDVYVQTAVHTLLRACKRPCSLLCACKHPAGACTRVGSPVLVHVWAHGRARGARGRERT